MLINNTLFLPIIVSFFLTLFLMPIWIRKAKQIKLVWDDMNKISGQKVAGSGGAMVLFGFIIGIMLLIAYRVFVMQTQEYLIEIFATLVVIILVSGTGIVDDLLGWRKGGLSRRSRIILIAFSAIPLMAINAGKSRVALPILGTTELGIIYPLLFIPIGIIGATTTFNFLAGYNGQEAGQGILILTALSFVAFFTGNSWISVICLCMVASLFAFLLFNFYPAEVFPGNAMTYATGALIASVAIIGNFERIAVFFFIPYIIETALKLKGKLVKQSFGQPTKKGTLKLRYPNFYSLNHLAIHILNKTKFKATEKRVVCLIWAFQILIILAGFIIFREGIFA